MLFQRVVTAVVLILLILLSLFVWQGLFPVLIVLMLLVSAWEWGELADIRSKRGIYSYIAAVIVSFLLCVFFQQHLESFAFRISALVFWLWVLLLPLLVKFPETKPFFQSSKATALMGFVILLATAVGLMWLRSRSNGAWLVLCLIVIVALADSGAYFSGKQWGRNKLAPDISPGKSFEGLYGGLMANFLFSVVLLFILDLDPEKSFSIVFIVLLTSLVSVEGDLLESAIKRSQGVKDSGTILPGHGGVLDRIDGIVAATPCFVFCVLFFGYG